MPGDERFRPFIQECLSLQNVIRAGETLSEVEHQIVTSHLEMLLDQLERMPRSRP
jgi:hypothetical protein